MQGGAGVCVDHFRGMVSIFFFFFSFEKENKIEKYENVPKHSC